MNYLLVAENIRDKKTNSNWIAPDAHGQKFFDMDVSLQGLLKLYLSKDLREHITPHYSRLGETSGGCSSKSRQIYIGRGLGAVGALPRFVTLI